MFRATILLALAGLLATSVARGGDADPVTAQLPKASPVFVRIESLARADAVARELAPLLEEFGATAEAAMLRGPGIMPHLAALAGIDAATVDRDRPLYLALLPGREGLLVAHPAAGAAWEGERALARGNVALLRGGALVMGAPEPVALETRATPTATLPGDIGVHVHLGELTEAYRDEIESGFAHTAMMGAAAPGVPDAVRSLVLPLVGASKEAVFGVESLDYALTWNDGRLDARGLLATKPRSALRAFLARAGPPAGTSPMVGYLPPDAFLTYDAACASDWPARELAALLDKALGEGTGAALLGALGPASAVQDRLTGRSVGCVTLLGMGASVVNIAELAEGTDAAHLFDDVTFDAANAALKKLGVPLTIRLAKGFDTHGDTKLHRIVFESENLQLAMLASMTQTLLAAEGRHLFVVSSPAAGADIADLLDRVRAGRAHEHPHARAMARLGRTRNLGVTVNLAGLKPLMLFVGFALPKRAAALIEGLPGELTLSTAVTLASGDVAWHGDWPARDIAKLAAKIAPRRPAASDPAPKEEEDFK